MIIHNDRQELQKALQYVEEELKKYNLNRREATMTMLMAEESLVCMMSHTEEQEKIEIVFKKLLGNISLNISARVKLLICLKRAYSSVIWILRG